MKQRILLITSLFLTFTCLSASDLKFMNMNDIYGISVRETTSITKDANGFIWIASRTGVIRLTDTDHRIYQLPHESMAVVSVEVSWQEGQLFAFTNQGEIFYYNPLQDNFERYFNFPQQINISGLWLYDLKMDRSGGLWIASSEGLYYYKDNECIKITTIKGSVNDMTRYDNEHILVAGTEGIYLIDTQQRQAEQWIGNMGIIPTSLLLDKEMNRLWIGTMSSGLYYFDYVSKKLHVSSVKNFPQQCVKDIMLVSNSSIWCGIDGRGVWELSRDGSQMIHIHQEDPDNPLTIKGNGVYDMYYESHGRVWICSVTGGVSVADLASPTAVRIQHRIKNPNSLINNHVHALIEDSRGQLWMGTNSGLSYWNPHTNKWINYFEKRDSEAFIILSLCEDNDGNIWVGTYAHGVYVFDGKNPRIIAHHTQPTGILAKTGFVFDILKDRDGDLWLAGMGGEILKYDYHIRKFEAYPMAPVYAIEEWNDRTLILGCSYGLLALDKNTKKLTTLVTDNMIQDIVVVKDKIWAGSNGGGLLSYNIRTKKTEKYDTRHGLISNYVNNLIYADGYLMLGTDNGICSFNTVNNMITTYLYPMFISNISCNPDACFRLQSGMFAWGTSDGVLMMDPKSQSRQGLPDRIYIQDILLSGESIRKYPDLLPKVPLDSINSITLSHQQNNVTLHVLPLGNYSRAARFSWKMQGFDDEWSAPTDQRVIRYTNLNPGTYQLSVRLYNHDLVSERTLTIHITPPFWATWWFRLAYIVLTCLLIYFLLRFYINRLNQRHTEDKLRFFTNIAHDLRTALTLVKAPIEELNRSNSLSEHDRQYLHLATEQTHRLTSVATQLLDFQRVGVGKEHFMPIIADIVVLAGYRVNMFDSIAAAKHIRLTYHSDVDTCFTMIDISMMERVIDNLLSNAIKYSHEQSSVEVYLHGDEDKWRLKVVDYGIGISRKAQEKLFNEFYRSQNAINAKIAGSGIGLFMVKMLVEMHGGKVSVESEEGKGSTIEIIVPRQDKIHNDEVYNETVSSLQDGVSSDCIDEDMRMLIVEDNDDLRNFMAWSLGKQFSVLTVANGVEAWEYIRQETPDLIVSDIMMPCMDGFELCRLVKSSFETSHIPVILLTALSEKTDELRGLGLGADDYITKPFDMKTLTQRIISIIRNRRIIGTKFIASGSTTEVVDIRTEEQVNILNDTFVKQAMEVVIRHLDDVDFAKDDFAKEMRVSTSLLFKKIKTLTGMSVVELIRSVRMEQAMRLLLEKKYSIGEIADKCGFSTIGYFSTIFKKHFGKSPTDFIS